MKRPALLRNRQTELVVGVVLFVAAAWCIYDAHEGRGRPRPFLASVLLP